MILRLQRLRQFAASALWLSACLLLVGCGTAPSAQHIVELPVYTPCVKDTPLAPIYEFDKLSLDAPAGEKIMALARDWVRGRKYESELEAALAGCLPVSQQ